MAPPLRLTLLGSFQAALDGRPVAGFVSGKAQALLAYLALAEGPRPRTELAALFWGETPDAAAQTSLRKALSNLHRLLGDHLIITRYEAGFDPASDYWVDALAFQHEAQDLLRRAEIAPAGPDSADLLRLQACAALYCGDLLAGVRVRATTAFEDWLLLQNERLHTLATRLLEQLTAQLAARGRYADALAASARLLALDPWNEDVHRQHMLLLACDGQRGAALHQYDLCRRMLLAEFGVPPNAETQALYGRLVEGEQFGAAAPASVAAADRRNRWPFTGRETEHAWLLTRWRAALRGGRGLTMVAGDAGIGKTRLVQEVLRFIAGQGGRILSGRCYEFNRALPYQAIHEALRVSLQQDSPAAAPLLRLLRSEGGAAGERAALFAAFAAHLQALRRRQRGGLVFFLDDLQWADADTLDLLHYLVRADGDAPCWLIGAYRPTETPPEHPLMRLAAALGDGLAHTLALPPLTGSEVAQLTTRLFGRVETPVAAYLHRESGGNPFAITELLETLHEQGIVAAAAGAWELVGDLAAPRPLPAHVYDVIRQRVARLPETDQYLLALAAAHGWPFTTALLAEAGEGDPAAVEAALAAWQARQLVRPIAAGWDLAHDSIRAALYQAVPPPLRRLLHARLAAALAAQQPDEVALLAHHYDLARQTVLAAHYLLQAGDRARLAYAHEQARAAYERGLALSTDPAQRYALLSGLEAVYDMTSCRAEQRAVLAELAELVTAGPPALQTPRTAIEVALRQAHHAEATSDYPAAVAAAERAVTLALTAGDDIFLAAGLRQWGYALRRQERMPEARALYERARAAAERVGAQPVLADSLQGLANIALHEGEYAAARANLARSLAVCRGLGDRRGEADAHNILGIVAQREGQPAEAETQYRRALALRREIGDRRGQGLSHNNLGAVALDAGQLDAAEAAYTAAAALCREADDRWGLAIAVLGLAEVAFARGACDRGQAYAQEALVAFEQVGARRRAEQAQRLLAQIATHQP